ncbi:hypothetical protein MPER_16391, partial [Moniliophthora perniciosa FA553]
CLGYFIKYLDPTNIGNAYASGMKEDLNIQGDEYSLLFTVGYVVEQYPGTLVMVKRMSLYKWLPCHLSPNTTDPRCEILWVIDVMCCTAAPN